jgi:hypothetical protein
MSDTISATTITSTLPGTSAARPVVRSDRTGRRIPVGRARGQISHLGGGHGHGPGVDPEGRVAPPAAGPVAHGPPGLPFGQPGIPVRSLAVRVGDDHDVGRREVLAVLEVTTSAEHGGPVDQGEGVHEAGLGLVADPHGDAVRRLGLEPVDGPHGRLVLLHERVVPFDLGDAAHQVVAASAEGPEVSASW